MITKLNSAALTMPLKHGSLVLAIFLLAVFFTAETVAQPEDVTGWQKTYWGMTPEELEKVYGGLLGKKPTGDGYFVYTISNYEIYGALFTVVFHWEDHNKLSGIQLSYWDNAYSPNLTRKFEAALKSKYGKYELLEDKHEPRQCAEIEEGAVCTGGVSKKVQFIFPSTTIEYDFSTSQIESNLKDFLEINKSGRIYSTNIFIRYMANQSDKL